MAVFDPNAAEAQVRVAELLVEREGLLQGAAVRLASQADLSDMSDEALAREAKRLADEVAQPTDFADGRARSYLRALKRHVLSERLAKQRTTVDLKERLKQMNPLLERLTLLRRN
jgi:hypothetical protein